MDPHENHNIWTQATNEQILWIGLIIYCYPVTVLFDLLLYNIILFTFIVLIYISTWYIPLRFVNDVAQEYYFMINQKNYYKRGKTNLNN